MTNGVPRPEYPRPQFVRVDANNQPDWLCLNGEWEFCIDSGDSGLDRGLPTEESWPQRIMVPFCPESELSGVGNKDFMHVVWYRRTVTIPEEWGEKEIVLHFQAVDYDATVWAIKGAGPRVEIGRHRGGFTPFDCALRRADVHAGDTVTLIVRARDSYEGPQPRGKQSKLYAPHGCEYTRTTGIWQTVWLEALPVPAALKRPRITPDVAAGMLRITQPLTRNPKGYRLHALVRDGDGIVSEAHTRADLDFAPCLDLPIPEDRRRLWSPTDPFLYDLTIELLNAEGAVVDRLNSYAGLRSISIDGKKICINGKTIFQRLVLDQGYYPEGVMTAPSDAALIEDIQLSLALGFNGARLHQKVFEERFLYHADRLGYLCWGEFGDWGASIGGPDTDHQKLYTTFPAQFLEALERDYSHPAIVGWCPLNETWQKMSDRITILDDAARAMFLACKAMDTTRPVLDTSGYSHRVFETDVYDSHDYITEEDFADGLANFATREGKEDWTPFVNPQYPGPLPNTTVWSLPYDNQPYFCSEFGGFKWTHDPDRQTSADVMPGQTWGYGPAPRTPEEFLYRFESTCRILMDNPHHFGFCYTQLTDIFPEENGLYTFGRNAKFDTTLIRAILDRPAAIEEG